MSIKIPFQINNKGLATCSNVKQSLDSFISLLLTTSCQSTPLDPQFGFVFNNLRFEMFNENEGVVYNSSLTEDEFSDNKDIYTKKISGSSKNLNTFSSELKAIIETYEKRLTNVSVLMTYIREDRVIHVTVKGVIIDTSTDYQYVTKIKIWN